MKKDFFFKKKKNLKVLKVKKKNLKEKDILFLKKKIYRKEKQVKNF
jgi:predicted CopG family antitoxin